MIGQLSGIIRYKKIPNLIIECAGVGYEVEASVGVFSSLPNLGEPATIYTHLSIRDDAHVLFGFASLEERDLFRVLIKVSGIGPKMGIVILSGMNPLELATVIAAEDSVSLTKLPGIGKKTAERLVVELKDKFKDLSKLSLSNAEKQAVDDNRVLFEAMDALIALGYKPVEAEKMVKSANAPDLDSEALIRKALQLKMKR